MGDYSSICAISGLPITGNQKIVGFNLEKHRYFDEGGPRKNLYVPASWPVIGEYDYMGGIEEEPLETDCALIHLDVWNNAHLYWHYLNRPYVSGWLGVEGLLSKAQKEEKLFSERGWKQTDYLFYCIRDAFQQTDFGLVFRNMIKGQSNCAGGDPEKHCFLERGRFMEIILDKIATGTWTAGDQSIVDKLVCLYSGQMITGRVIMPSNTIYPEQYPNYKQRLEILNLTLGIAKKLNKKTE